MRAFLILQTWPKIAKMTSGDLLTLKMVLTEPPRNTGWIQTLIRERVKNQSFVDLTGYLNSPSKIGPACEV